MYEGDGVYDEVKQNAYDQQHPPLTGMNTMEYKEHLDHVVTTQVLPKTESVRIPGLSQRQMDLIDNKDDGLPEAGAARERRLQVIDKDMKAIRRFLPRMEEVREFLGTMEHNEDEDLIEALAMADCELRGFISKVTRKLNSLEAELELKKVVE